MNNWISEKKVFHRGELSGAGSDGLITRLNIDATLIIMCSITCDETFKPHEREY